MHAVSFSADDPEADIRPFASRPPAMAAAVTDRWIGCCDGSLKPFVARRMGDASRIGCIPG